MYYTGVYYSIIIFFRVLKCIIIISNRVNTEFEFLSLSNQWKLLIIIRNVSHTAIINYNTTQQREYAQTDRLIYNYPSPYYIRFLY